MKKVKMDFVEISRLYNAITSASRVKFKAHPKFRYALAKNRDHLEPFIKQLREASKLPEDEDIDAYEEARKELIKSYAGKKPIVPPEKQADFLADLEILQEGDFKKGWKKVEEFKESVDEFQKEKQDVQLYFVHMDLIPEDLDDQSAVNDLFPIFTEELVNKKGKSAE